MEKVQYLPLGSVVAVNGALKKTMIIARALAVEVQPEPKIFDYAGCIFPEGLIGDQVMYFNHADISEVAFEGFNNEENVAMVEYINTLMEKTKFERGNHLELNKQKHDSGTSEKDSALAD